MNAVLEMPAQKIDDTLYNMYNEIKLSEKEIAEGKVKNAEEALHNLRAKYDI